MTKKTRLARTLLAAGHGLSRPLPKRRQCSLQRLETITYSDNTTKWVIGQTATVTCVAPTTVLPTGAAAGTVISATTFDATTAMPLTTSAFGKLQTTATYNTDGTLATIKDLVEPHHHIQQLVPGDPASHT